MNNPTCGGCRYYLETLSGVRGDCHANPPAPVLRRDGDGDTLEYHRPEVAASDLACRLGEPIPTEPSDTGAFPDLI